MRYKPFVTVETFNEFKKIKLSSDSSNITYITYDDPVQTFGTPDILWKQIVFVLDKGIIYSKGQIFTNIEDTLTSQDIKTINSYNIVGSGNVEITPSNLIISSYYQTSYLSNSYLLIQSGDTVENAISKLEKSIITNSYLITQLEENSLVVRDVHDDGLFFTDSYGYIGVKITSQGLFAINSYNNSDSVSYLSTTYETTYETTYTITYDNNINIIDY